MTFHDGLDPACTTRPGLKASILSTPVLGDMNRDDHRHIGRLIIQGVRCETHFPHAMQRSFIEVRVAARGEKHSSHNRAVGRNVGLQDCRPCDAASHNDSRCDKPESCQRLQIFELHYLAGPVCGGGSGGSNKHKQRREREWQYESAHVQHGGHVRRKGTAEDRSPRWRGLVACAAAMGWRYIWRLHRPEQRAELVSVRITHVSHIHGPRLVFTKTWRLFNGGASVRNRHVVKQPDLLR